MQTPLTDVKETLKPLKYETRLHTAVSLASKQSKSQPRRLDNTWGSYLAAGLHEKNPKCEQAATAYDSRRR